MALRGPGAALKSMGLMRGPWKMPVGRGGSRRAKGPDAMANNADGLNGLVRSPAGRALERCLCRASLV